MAVAQAFSVDVAIRYVLLVLWLTSLSVVVARKAMRACRRCDTGAESDIYEV